LLVGVSIVVPVSSAARGAEPPAGSHGAPVEIVKLSGGGQVAFTAPVGSPQVAEGPLGGATDSLRGRQLPRFVRVVGAAVRVFAPDAASAHAILSFPTVRAPAGMVPVLARALPRFVAIDKEWSPGVLQIPARRGEVGAWLLSPAEFDSGKGLLVARLGDLSDLPVLLAWVPAELMKPTVSTFVAPARPVFVADHDLELDDAPNEARLALAGGARVEYERPPKTLDLASRLRWRVLDARKKPPPLKRPDGPLLVFENPGEVGPQTISVSVPAHRPGGAKGWRPVVAIEELISFGPSGPGWGTVDPTYRWALMDAEFDETTQRIEADLPPVWRVGRLRFGWERSVPADR
jgi:hypothetical protein